MSNIVSGSDGVFKRGRGWQDTSAPPNVVINALGPGLISLALQRYNDVANQPYHRESVKGQTADIANVQPLYHLAPQVLTAALPDMDPGALYRKDSVKGQSDPWQNWALSGIPVVQVTAVVPTMVINPVYKRKELTQDTTVQRNPLLDLVSVAPIVFPTQFLDEETYHRDSMGGQYLRTNTVVVTGPPFPVSEIYTFVHRAKVAQEPYLFPNVIIRAVSAVAPPFVQSQREDREWRGKKTQEPYALPNLLITQKPVTSPFVFAQREDFHWRGKKVPEPYDFWNPIIRNIPPSFVQPFVYELIEHHFKQRQYTQDVFVLPNLLALQISPIGRYTLGQALVILASAGFTVDPVITWEYSTTVPYYYMISQLPDAGDVILYQDVAVKLVVSAGPPPPSEPTVDVPAVTGVPLLLAMEMLSANSLNLGTVTYFNDPVVPINQVTDQSPAALTTVDQYTSVNLTVCAGPLQDILINDPYTVPNVVTTPPVPPPTPPTPPPPNPAGGSWPAGGSTPAGSD